MKDLALKEAGLKATVPRIKILSMLEESQNRHLSAEDIYKNLLNAGNDVGLATVYRVLTQFEKAGLVIRHNFDSGHSVFELNNAGSHDHMLCVKCGYVAEFIDDLIEEQQETIAKRLGFSLTDHSLYLYGLCSKCKT